jgi:hypothetical protein
MFPINPITIVSASVVVTLLLIAGFTVLIKLNKIEQKEDRKREKEQGILFKMTFPCRKCGRMITPVHIKDNKWGYKCSCKNSWILKI